MGCKQMHLGDRKEGIEQESVHSFEKQSEVSRRLNFPSFFLLPPSSYILRTDGRPCISPPLFSQKKNSPPPPPPLLFSLLSDPPPPFGRGRRRRAVCSVCAAAKETHGGAPAIMQPRAATTTTYTYYKQQGREGGRVERSKCRTVGNERERSHEQCPSMIRMSFCS